MGKKHSKDRKQSQLSTTDKNSYVQTSVMYDTPITSLGVNNDQLVAADDKGVLHLFDLESRKFSDKFKVHERGVTQVAISGDGQSCFTSSRDKTIKVSNLAIKSPLQTLTGHNLAVTALSVNPVGTTLISGSRDCTVKLWDTEKEIALRSSNVNRNIVTALKLIEEENLIIQCAEDKIMKLWDTRTLKNVSTFPIKQYFQTCLDFDEVRSQILTGSTGFNGNGCEVILWDLRQLRSIHCLKEHTEKITGCKILQHGSISLSAITVSHDCNIKVWDLITAECIATEYLPGAREITCVDVNDYKMVRFCIGTFNAGIRVINYDATVRSLKNSFVL